MGGSQETQKKYTIKRLMTINNSAGEGFTNGQEFFDAFISLYEKGMCSSPAVKLELVALIQPYFEQHDETGMMVVICQQYSTIMNQQSNASID